MMKSPADLASQTQQAIGLSKIILTEREKVEDRIEMLQSYKKLIYDTKAAVLENMTRNQKVLRDFQASITNKIKSAKDRSLASVNPSDTDNTQNQDQVTKVSKRKEIIDKVIDDIEEEQVQINYVKSDNPPEKASIVIISHNYIQTNKRKRDRLDELEKNEQQHSLTSKVFDIKVGEAYSLGKEFVSIKPSDTLELKPQ